MNASPRLNVASYTLIGFGLLWAGTHALTGSPSNPPDTLLHSVSAPALQMMAHCTETQCGPTLTHPRQ